MENLADIASDIVKEVLIEVIEDLVGTPNFHVSLEAGSKKGDNFMGIVHRVSFDRKDAKGGKKKHCKKLMLKIAPTNEDRRNALSVRASFLREMTVYNEILPYFHEFQKSKGILIDEYGFHEYPKCYKTIDTDMIECLFLEDLGEQMFTMVNLHTEEMTVHHVKLVMQVMGKFHALSFALKDQEPEKFEDIVSNLPEAFFTPENTSIALLFNGMPKILFDAITNDDDAYLLLHLVRLYERSQFDMCLECVDSTLAEPYCVINHGDCWPNNVLYKYDVKPVEACLIDFQMARYSSPICDLVYFLFTSTSKEMRDKHYDDFLKTYHESLSYTLHRLGSDPLKLFPYKAMLKELRKFGKYGLFMSCVVVPVIEAEDVGSVDDMAKEIGEGKNVHRHRKPSDIVEDMYRLKYI